MPLLDTELTRREGSHIAVSPQPLRITCQLADLATADGFGLHCTFTASIRVGPAPADKVMVGEVLLANRTSITTRQVAEYFAAALASSAASAAAEHDIAWWLGKDGPSAMLDALRKAGHAVAFRSGLELLEPMSADLASPDFHRQQFLSRQAKIAEQRAAEQIGHLHRSAELLREFHVLRESAPQLSPGAALEQLSPADRGSILQSLLKASAAEGPVTTDRLFAVAGPYLAEIDTRVAGSPRLHPIPDALGPLRSVQPAMIGAERRLLVGARGGFYVIDPANPSNVERYAIPAETSGAAESALGFNRVLYQPSTGFWATHAELGLINWAVGDGNAPRQIFGPAYLNIAVPAATPPPLPSYTMSSIAITAAGPRHLVALGETLLFSVGPRLFHFAGTAAQPVALGGAYGANIAAIVSDGAMIAVVFEDGSVWTPDPPYPIGPSSQWTCRAQRGSAVCAAGLLPWLESARLLLATLNGPIDCIGLDDPLVTQYAGPTAPGSRAVAGSANCVAAISRDRQRLLLWHTWNGARPSNEIYLAAQAHHRIADIAFA
ncbi:MAG TPA: hypothetical protein VHY37_06285 [Tepidisphaeraceae bacterium]|nr:hypothetical protein [Tepidisphaeraceae bacterium]